MALLHNIMPDVAALVPRRTAVVEFGAGSATKTPILLDAIAPAAYVPVDISGDHLKKSAEGLQQGLPRASSGAGRRGFCATLRTSATR